MSLLAELEMPRGPGRRPEKKKKSVAGEGTGRERGGTAHVRVHDDLADMIGAIVALSKTSSAKLIGPMIRDEIEELYAALDPADLAAYRRVEAAKKKKPSGE